METAGNKKEKAGYITSKDTIDTVYPGLIPAVNFVRPGMETRRFYKIW